MSLKRVATLVAFVITLGALVLQIFLTVSTQLSHGHSLISALVFYFSFFTITSNLMLAAIYLSDLVGWGWLRWWRTPWVRGMMAGAIALVMVVYHFLLFGLADIDIWFIVADRTLHYVDPVLYIVWWLAVQPHGKLRWGQIPLMLAYPLIYIAYAMARGAVTAEYPYPFLAADKLGYGQVAINCVFMFVGVIVIYAAVIWLDRLLQPRRQPA